MLCFVVILTTTATTTTTSTLSTDSAHTERTAVVTVVLVRRPAAPYDGKVGGLILVRPFAAPLERARETVAHVIVGQADVGRQIELAIGKEKERKGPRRTGCSNLISATASQTTK